MVLPSLHRRVFKVFYRGLSLAVVRVWMSFTGLGRAVTFAPFVIFRFVVVLCSTWWSRGEAGKGGKPRNRNEVTQLTGTPGVLGHTIDLGNAVAWSSCVAESSKASDQVGWRNWVRCCEQFGYDPY